MGGVSKTGEEALWWLGWHRRYVLSFGVAVGFVVGYLTEGIGAVGLVSGLVLAGAAVLRRRFVALEVVVLGVAAVVAYAFGVEEAVSAVGVEDAAVGVTEPILDVLGVEYADALSAAEGGITSVGFWYFAGFGFGILVWSLGAAVVNRTYQESYDAFRDLIQKKGEALLGEGTRTTFNGTGSMLGIRPSREYHATNIRVRPSSIDLNYGSALSMPRKALSVKGSTKHLYYDQLASVDYEEPYFEIRMAGGEVVRIVTEEEPSEILDEIERNLKRYKKAEERDEEATAVDARKEEVSETAVEASGSEDFSTGDESERRAEEAMERIEEVETIFESELEEVDEMFRTVDEEGDAGVEEAQVEIERE